MKLPNCECASVDVEKIKNYLLNETHKVGWSKAKYLRKAGFNGSNIDLLKDNLLNLACLGKVIDVKRALHGDKYVVYGSFLAPNLKKVTLNTVWCIDEEKIIQDL